MLSVLTIDQIHNQIHDRNYSFRSGTVDKNVSIIFDRQHSDLIEVVPSFIEIYPDGEKEFMITVLGKSPGHSHIYTNITSNTVVGYNIIRKRKSISSFIFFSIRFSEDELFLRVTVAISSPLIVISEIVGWIYFAAWSVSFYPQIYINFKRKSVVGYNFDYVSLNIVGFVMYSVFNCGLFWIKYIQVIIRLRCNNSFVQ